jgi:hypothetical protein
MAIREHARVANKRGPMPKFEVVEDSEHRFHVRRDGKCIAAFTTNQEAWDCITEELLERSGKVTGLSHKAEQKERRALVGSTSGTTYHALANLNNSLGGRFSPADNVAGKEPVVSYPALDWRSPWSGPRLPDEMPLGYAIGDQPTGRPEARPCRWASAPA